MLRRQLLLAMAGAAAWSARAEAPAATDRFEDASRLDPREPLEADLCIVGAGAAGITLARTLAGSGLRILLLEAGGRQIEGRTQALMRWKQTGMPYFDLAACRLRYFGGTTNHWAGYSTWPERVDFEPRADLGLPGWPIRYDTLRPYLTRALDVLGYAASFDPVEVARSLGEDPDGVLDGHSKSLKTELFRISRGRRFADIHGDALAAQPDLRVVLHANVVHLQLDPSGRSVREASLRTLDGPELRVRARRWVLAAHALENARLLLASNDVARAGIGNRHDMVGRFFMEHPAIVSGVLTPSPTLPRIYDEQFATGHDLNWTIGLSDVQARRLGVLQYQCRLMPVYAQDRVKLALARLRQAWWQPASAQAISDLAEVATHPADLAALVARSVGGMRFTPVAYRLEHRIEQAPNPDSRVTLDGGKDALGMPTARLHWSLGALDERTIGSGQATLARELERLGLGRIDAPPITRELLRRHIEGLNHHVGTVRMSADPREGVVDANCRVHDVDNLYVAGSAVFPRVGIFNPTLVIVALAMRLADHLRHEGAA